MTRRLHILATMILLAGYLLSCAPPIDPDRTQQIIDQSKKPGATPTPATIADVIIAEQAARKSLQDPQTGAKVTVEGLEPTDPNFVQRRGHAVAKIDEATTHIDTAIDKTKTAHGSATLDVKEKGALAEKVQKLEKRDPLFAWLTFGAILGIGLGVAAIVTSFFLPALIGKNVRAGGIATLASGLIVAAIAEYLDEIRLAIILTLAVLLGSGLVWAITWAIRNRKRFLDTVDHIQKGVDAGQIIITPEAKDPKTSLPMAYAADDTEAAIQARQKTLRKQQQKAARKSAMSKINDFANVAAMPERK